MGEVIKFKVIPLSKTFGSRENDYKIYTCKSDDENVKFNNSGKVSIKGNIHELPIGVEHTVIGKEAYHSDFKYSYDIVSIEREIPNDNSSTMSFLKEILTTSQAEVLIDIYPDIVDRVIEGRLEDIDLNKTKGIKESTFKKIQEKIIDNFAISKAIIEFGGLIDFKTLKKLYEKYKSTNMIKEKLSKEPYESLCQLSRVGFLTADSIMKNLEKRCRDMELKGEIPPIKFEGELISSKDRMRSSIYYVLKENEEKDRNTKMKLIDLKTQANLLTKECMSHFSECIKESLDILHISSDGYVSRKSTYEKALYIAGKVFKAVESPVEWNLDVEKYRKEGDNELTSEQFQTIEEFPRNNIYALQGFAGVGKSYSMEVLVRMLKDNNKRVLILSPTGRASKVISNYTGHSASTIHRGLGYNGEWNFNHFNHLNVDVVIVEETSMGDLDLMYRLFCAIDFSKTKLLLVGDFEQLASVSCGNVFYDLVTSGIIKTTYLTKVFRYGIGGIDTVVTKIRNGEMYIPKDLKKPMFVGEDKSFMFIPSKKENTLKTTLVLYKSLLDKGYRPEDILVLSSQNIGDYGTIKINSYIQKLANSHNIDDNLFIESTSGKHKTRYYINDLVMQTSNNYKAKEFLSWEGDNDLSSDFFIPNGEIGVLREINDWKNKCIVGFDKDILYDKGNLSSCMLAYAISIHKSQGGQAKVVILLTPRSHIHMMNSNILYVGASRAQNMLIQIGEPSILPMILRKKENLTRVTNLSALLSKKKEHLVYMEYNILQEKINSKAKN